MQEGFRYRSDDRRNYSQLAELSLVIAAEALTADEQENRIGDGDCIGANSVSSSAIRSAIEADRAIREPVASSSGASPTP